MAEMDETVPPEIERQLDEQVGAIPVKDTGPQYAVYQPTEQMRIPVSKSFGKLIRARRDAAQKAMQPAMEAWDEAVRYYRNDQSHRRTADDPNQAGNRGVSRRMNNTFSETENIVFANVNAMVPALYAKNPQMTITAHSEENEDLAHLCGLLVNALAARKAEPGFNLKPKAKRCVIMATLTNQAYLEVGYTFKDLSSDAAVAELQSLAKELETAKTQQEIEEIEGKLMALEASVDMLRPQGPFVKYRKPGEVLRDPNALEEDLTDANWIMVCDYLPSAFIKAKFTKKDENRENVLIYEPTHVLALNKGKERTDIDDEVAHFELLGDKTRTDEYKQFGFEDNDTFERCKVTKVWFYWDKVTRRVYLFHDKDWTWPIWVWDDPYKLDTFFNVFPLSFIVDPTTPNGRGEVSYYLDQQDAINEINDEQRRARQWVRRNVFFNNRLISRTDVEAVLKGDDGTARGIDVPDGMTVQDCIFSFAPPSVNFPMLFNKEEKLQSIDRVSSVTDVIRGAQFKTNTTNMAIESYTSTTNLRIDEKIDAVEDWLSGVFWAVLQMCLQNMDQETVAGIVGQKYVGHWRKLSAEEIRNNFSCRVVGGSTAKPTSAAKKREAIEAAQVLGQFVNANPPLVMFMMVQMFSKAFDETTIPKQAWEQLEQSLQGNVQEQQVAVQIMQAIQQMSPEQTKALGMSIAQGVPLPEAVKLIMENGNGNPE